MKPSHQMTLELLEQTLQPASYFQLQAAKHRVLVIRNALAADEDLCEALLHKSITCSAKRPSRRLTLAR